MGRHSFATLRNTLFPTVTDWFRPIEHFGGLRVYLRPYEKVATRMQGRDGRLSKKMVEYVQRDFSSRMVASGSGEWKT